MKAAVPEAEYEHIAPDTIDGQPYKVNISGPGGTYTGIVSYSENAEFAIKLFDWMLDSPENYFTTKQGILEKDWNWADKNKGSYVNLKDKNNPTSGYNYTFSTIMYSPWDFEDSEAGFVMQEYFKSWKYQRRQEHIFNPDWNITYSWKGTSVEQNIADAQTFIEEAISKIITGEEPNSYWDKAVTEYRRMFADEYIELATQQYNKN